MNLWEKLVKLRESIGSLSKDTKGYQYTYVSGNQILSKIKDEMNELKLLLVPSNQVGQWDRHFYNTQQGKEKIAFLCWGQASYTWINAEKPEERETTNFAYYGQQDDDLSKAYGTALTYMERYFLLKFFGLPTDEDDPDKNQEPKYAKPKGISEAQIKRLNAIAYGKGYDFKSVLKTAQSKFKVNTLEDLTIDQYNQMCEGFEKAEQNGKK